MSDYNRLVVYNAAILLVSAGAMLVSEYLFAIYLLLSALLLTETARL